MTKAWDVTPIMIHVEKLLGLCFVRVDARIICPEVCVDYLTCFVCNVNLEVLHVKGGPIDT